METLFQDLRYGFRMLLKRPGFTAVAVLALALGIGANSAIFSVVNTILLRPLPYQKPDQLVWVWDVQTQIDKTPASYPEYLDWRDQSRAFEQLSAFYRTNLNLTGAGEPERIQSARVSANFFTLLGVNPILGR